MSPLMRVPRSFLLSVIITVIARKTKFQLNLSLTANHAIVQERKSHLLNDTNIPQHVATINDTSNSKC